MDRQDVTIVNLFSQDALFRKWFERKPVAGCSVLS